VAVLSFALDEDVSHPVARLLRRIGHVAESATELDRLGLRDVQVLLRATERNQTVVTHNKKDFELLHEAWVTWRRRWMAEAETAKGLPVPLSRHVGIVIVPHLPNHELVRILSDFASTAEAVDDKLFTWSQEQGWEEVRF
jgi:hypothetical protein